MAQISLGFTHSSISDSCSCCGICYKQLFTAQKKEGERESDILQERESEMKNDNAFLLYSLFMRWLFNDLRWFVWWQVTAMPEQRKRETMGKVVKKRGRERGIGPHMQCNYRQRRTSASGQKCRQFLIYVLTTTTIATATAIPATTATCLMTTTTTNSGRAA